MAISRRYFGVENIALTAPQRQTLVEGLQSLGANTDEQPSHRNHWRVRLDSDAVIFEASFDDTNFTVANLRQRLATLFGVPLAQVTNVTSTPSVGTLLTISYQSVARVRFVLFGGSTASYADSQAAARQYLADNAAAWEGNPD